MGDYDNTREDDHDDKTEREQKARDDAMEFYRDNWLTAVTQSVEKSNGTFDDVTDYEAVKKLHFWDLTSMSYPKRPANSVDIFVEELNNLDFMERAAKILIDLHAKLDGFHNESIVQLFDDMAANYADYKYENSIKD